MARCHNCGRETLRTQDWACQWCGYPLMSPAFGKIDKTYRQIKEEKLCQTEVEAEAEAEIETDIPSEKEMMAAVAIVEELVQEVTEEEPVPQTEAEPTSDELTQPEAEVKEEPIEEKVEPEIEAVIEEEVKDELKQEPEATIEEPEAVAVDEYQTVSDMEVEVEEATEEEQKPSAEMEAEPEAEPEPEPETELGVPDEEIDVVEIFQAYDSDDAAADARFGDKLIRVTGTLSLIDVKDVNDKHYVRLTSSEDEITQSLKCLFDKEHGPMLCKLEKGQVVTVQGRYNGSIIAMRMLDCNLVC